MLLATVAGEGAAVLSGMGIISSVPLWLSYANWFAGVIAMIMVGLFVARLARFVSEPRLAREARFVWSAWVLLGWSNIALLLAVWTSDWKPSAAITGISRLVIVLWWMAGIAMYVHLIAALRRVLLRRQAMTIPPETESATMTDPAAAGWLAERPASLARVAAGLRISAAGIVLGLVALAIPLARSIAPELPWSRDELLIAAGCLLAIGHLAELAGAICCLAAPKRPWPATPFKSQRPRRSSVYSCGPPRHWPD